MNKCLLDSLNYKVFLENEKKALRPKVQAEETAPLVSTGAGVAGCLRTWAWPWGADAIPHGQLVLGLRSRC